MDKNQLKSIFKPGWHSRLGQTKCGNGSEGKYAHIIVMMMEIIVKKLNIKTVADVGCGDLNIGATILPFIDEYYGYDLVDWGEEWNLTKQLARSLNKKFILKSDFSAVHDLIAPVDIIFCNNVFTHYSNEDVVIMLENFKKSGSKMLWCWENNIHITENDRKGTVASRESNGSVNLSLPPFNLSDRVDIATDFHSLCEDFFFIRVPNKKITVYRINP